MINMPVLIGQMETLAVLILMGFAAQRMRLLNNENIDNLSTIMTRLILPCMLISLIGDGGTRSELFGMWKFMIATFFMLLLALGIGFLVSRVIGLPQPTKNMHILITGMGNGGFIGIPIVGIMFPTTGALPIAVFALAEASICWILGPLIADTSPGAKKINLKTLVTPTTISILLGIAMILFNINISGNVVWETVKSVGSTTKYFAAIYIGLDLGRKGLKKILGQPKVFISAPFKLVIFPVIAYLLFGKTGILQGDALIILTLFIATPTGMAIPLIAKMTNSDEAYATAGTMLSTIMCLFTMPFVMWLVSQL